MANPAMRLHVSAVAVVVVVVGLLSIGLLQPASARPYFFWGDSGSENQMVAPPPPPPTINPNLQHQLQELLKQQEMEQLQPQQQQQQQQQQQLQQQPQQQSQQQQQQLQQSANGAGEAPVRQRISGHLNQLVSHGSTAMRSVVDSVQPDLTNIRKDLGEVYEATRDNVNKRIEPLAQTVRPYLDHAQKVVAPYVNSAREEMPKLLQKAAPALQKVSEHMREKIHGALEKLQPEQKLASLTGGGSGYGATPTGGAQQSGPLAAAQGQLQQASDTVAQQASELNKSVQQQ